MNNDEVVTINEQFEGTACYMVTNEIFKKGIVKIGRSKDVFSRLYSLARYSGLPTEFQIICVFDDRYNWMDGSLESILQNRYVSKQVKTAGTGYGTEYFELTEEDVRDILVDYFPAIVAINKRFMDSFYKCVVDAMTEMMMNIQRMDYNNELIDFKDWVRVYSIWKANEQEKNIEEVILNFFEGKIVKE